MDKQNVVTVASELAQGLAKFPTPSEVFVLTRTMPGQEGKEYRFRVALLRKQDEMDALRDAQSVAREFGELQGYDDIYKEAQAVEIIARCLVAPDPYDRPDGTIAWHRVFTDAKDVRLSLINSECAQILNAYEVVRQKYNAVRSIAQGDLDEWTRRLGDDTNGADFLSHLDSSLWGPLLLILAKRLAPFVGSPPSTSQGTGESDQQNSSGTTGSFTTLPAMRSEDGRIDFPTDKLLNDLEASELAEKL